MDNLLFQKLYNIKLIAMDFDEAGAKGLSFWLKNYERAKDWPVPAGKDPGDAFALGVDLALWLQAGLPQSMRQIVSPVVSQKVGVKE